MNLSNVGIIGLGGMGQMMLADMRRHEGYFVAVAWDPDKKTRQVVQAHYPDLRMTSDAADLINDSAIDLVYVASPPNTHREYFLAAIAAGRHMLCEKPFGVDVTESEDLLERIGKAGIRNVINFDLLWNYYPNAIRATYGN